MQGIAGPIGSMFSRVASHLVLDNPENGLRRAPDLHDSVEQAKLEWMCARAYFEQVTDPELIDYAIYQVTASERRYMYLLGQARSGWGPHPAGSPSEPAPAVALAAAPPPAELTPAEPPA